MLIKKTNVMRILDQKKINYLASSCDQSLVNAVDVANALGRDLSMVFKTLVTKGLSNKYYVFVIASHKALDLKKAAIAVGEKSVEMVAPSHLLALTGYVHGGCSPIGMKTVFETVVDVSARECQQICISAGKVGFQILISLESLQKAVPFVYADLTKS